MQLANPSVSDSAWIAQDPFRNPVKLSRLCSLPIEFTTFLPEFSTRNLIGRSKWFKLDVVRFHKMFFPPFSDSFTDFLLELVQWFILPMMTKPQTSWPCCRSVGLRQHKVHNSINLPYLTDKLDGEKWTRETIRMELKNLRTLP